MSLSIIRKLGTTLSIKHQTVLGQKRIIMIRKHGIRCIWVGSGPIAQQPLTLEVYILRLLIDELRLAIGAWQGPEGIGRCADAITEMLTRRIGHAIRWIKGWVQRGRRNKGDFSLTLRGLKHIRITVIALFILHSWRQVVQQKNAVDGCRWSTWR